MPKPTSPTLTDYCYVKPPDVRGAGELAESVIEEFPYDVKFYLQRSGYTNPKDIVRLARIFYHELPISPSERYDKSADTRIRPDYLAEVMNELGFIRRDLPKVSVRIWWMYYTICDAPREWFNQVYDTQPSLTDNFDFVRVVTRSLHESGDLCNPYGDPLTDTDIENIERFFGLLYVDYLGTYTPTSYRPFKYRSSHFDTIAQILPLYMGLGGNSAKVDRLIRELQHELEQRCEPPIRNWRQRLQQISEMRFGPDFEIMQRALATPIDALMLNPDDYQLLWDVDIRTIGDILINHDRLINELFVPELGYGPNRVMLGRVRDTLERLGYPSFELPPSFAVQE